MPVPAPLIKPGRGLRHFDRTHRGKISGEIDTNGAPKLNTGRVNQTRRNWEDWTRPAARGMQAGVGQKWSDLTWLPTGALALMAQGQVGSNTVDCILGSSKQCPSVV